MFIEKFDTVMGEVDEMMIDFVDVLLEFKAEDIQKVRSVVQKDGIEKYIEVRIKDAEKLQFVTGLAKMFLSGFFGVYKYDFTFNGRRFQILTKNRFHTYRIYELPRNLEEKIPEFIKELRVRRVNRAEKTEVTEGSEMKSEVQKMPGVIQEMTKDLGIAL